MPHKMNKRQYDAVLAELEGKLITLEIERTIIIEGEVVERYEELNPLHDEISATLGAIEDAQRSWMTRNWNAGHWNTFDLITSNCD